MTAPPPATFDPAAALTLAAAAGLVALTSTDGAVLFVMGALAGAVSLAALLLWLDPPPRDDEERRP